MFTQLLKKSFYAVAFFACLPTWSSDIEEEKKSHFLTPPLEKLSDVSFDLYGNNALSYQESTSDSGDGDSHNSSSSYDTQSSDDNVSAEEPRHSSSILETLDLSVEESQYTKSQLITYIQFLEAEVDKNRVITTRRKASHQEIKEKLIESQVKVTFLTGKNNLLGRKNQQLQDENEKLRAQNNSLFHKLKTKENSTTSGF